MLDGRQTRASARAYDGCIEADAKGAAVARVLIVYASIDGQTARIAEHMAASLRGAGVQVTLRPARPLDGPGEIETHDAVVIGGSVRFGHHARALEKWVHERVDQLARRPAAFFSVSLCAAAGNGPKAREAIRWRDEFMRRTGWKPALATSFAGALRYTRYNPMVRLMMRFIAGRQRGATDTSRDYEYTDWAAVERFASDLRTRIAAAGIP
jgi:menaquinone-dependent protoporphyrinogen oxidase